MVRDYNFTEEEVELIKASMEVHTNEEQEFHLNNDNNSCYTNNNDGGGVIGGGLCLKVMTDEQMEVLRKQISVYATICEQLVQMHKSISAQQDFSGVGLGNLYCDSLITYAGNKNMTRHRWTPTPVQLQILERVFSQGIGTPSKQKIKDLTIELSQHGQISETNVYNWFQNRRARSKRKQFAEAPHNSDAEKTESVEKNMKPAEITNISANTISDSRCKGKLSFSPDHDLRLHGSYGRESAVYENVPGSSDLMDNVEQPKNFGP